MVDIFISYVEEDSAPAAEIGDGLQKEGYAVWRYQTNSLPGMDYLAVVGDAIDACQAVVVLISKNSLGSHQVTSEVVRAHDSGKLFVPILIGMNHSTFQKRQPTWRQAMGAATSIEIPEQGASEIVPRIIAGLKALGIVPRQRPEGGDPVVPPPRVGRRPRPRWRRNAAIAVAALAMVLVGWYLARSRRALTPESLSFTVGYLAARAQGSAAATLAVCTSGGSGCELVLSAQESPSTPAFFVKKLEDVSKGREWPPERFVAQVRDAVAAKTLLEIAKRARPGPPNEIAAPVQKGVDGPLNELMEGLEGEKPDKRAGDPGMLFAGIEVARIDLLFYYRRYAQGGGADQMMLPQARGLFSTLLAGSRLPRYGLDERLRPVLERFPGVESRLGSIELPELQTIVESLKKRFLDAAILAQL